MALSTDTLDFFPPSFFSIQEETERERTSSYIYKERDGSSSNSINGGMDN